MLILFPRVFRSHQALRRFGGLNLAGLKNPFEGKRKLSGPVPIQVRQTFPGLVDAWYMAGRNPRNGVRYAGQCPPDTLLAASFDVTAGTAGSWFKSQPPPSA
jgi:hypothetical protein